MKVLFWTLEQIHMFVIMSTEQQDLSDLHHLENDLLLEMAGFLLLNMVKSQSRPRHLHHIISKWWNLKM